MKISMVWMAIILRWLELLCPILVHYSSWTSLKSTTPISLEHDKHILVEKFSLAFFHHTKGPHICIQFLFTLLLFYVLFILFPIPYLPRFCLVLCSTVSTELEFELYSIFSPRRWHIFRLRPNIFILSPFTA